MIRRVIVRKTLLLVAVISSLAAAGCGGDSGGPDPGTPDAPPSPTLQRCVDATFTPGPTEPWKGTPPSGDPGHSSQDALVTVGAPALVRGKFAYGALSQDLEGETVKAWVWDCTTWVSAGEGLTDSDGRIELEAPSLGAGVYDVRFEVTGDASVTGSTLWVLPEGTHITVTDIDGTMTLSDNEFLRQIIDRSYVPKAYPSAVELIERHVEDGYIIVYLTGRPYIYTQLTRDWLSDLRFPLGALHVADSTEEALPTEGGVGTYKKEFLLDLEAKGFLIDVAYGNATTDIFAYLGAAIPADDVWIIGENAGQQGTHAVMDSWAERAAEVAAAPAVMQPF